MSIVSVAKREIDIVWTMFRRLIGGIDVDPTSLLSWSSVAWLSQPSGPASQSDTLIVAIGSIYILVWEYTSFRFQQWEL